MSIKIMIVDDHEIIRKSLKRMIELEEDLEVISICENGKEALDCIKTSNVDIVLMDAVMPVLNGIESSKLIKQFNDRMKILMLTTFSSEKLIFDAFSAKVDGYILKDIKGEALIECIRNCVKGEIIIPNEIAQKLAQSVIGYKSYKFNETETQVISLLVKGHTNKEIATDLNISYGTVRNYICGIYKKVQENNRNKVINILETNILYE